MIHWYHGCLIIGKTADGRWLFSIQPDRITWRSNGKAWTFKAPWSRAMFSERFGYNKTLWRAFGFRLLCREETPE